MSELEILNQEFRSISKEFDSLYPSNSGNINRKFYRDRTEFGSLYESYYENFSTFKRKALDDSYTEISRLKIKEDFVNKSYPKGFFVTSAIAGFNYHKDFFETIKKYCKHNNYELLIFPIVSPYNPNDVYQEDLIEYLVTRAEFNKRLVGVDLLISATTVNPLSGISRLSNKDHSLIIASPKQQMQMVPVSIGKNPHLLQSTGTISLPDYKNNKNGILAKNDHTIGGLVVEVKNESLFFTREIQANSADGSFYDLNKFYHKNKIEKTKDVEAIYLGDYHSGWTDETALNTTFEQFKLLNPKEVYVGDVFDGTSISHHHEKDIFAQLYRPSPIDTLEKELLELKTQLVDLTTKFPKINFNLIRGNHDEHLDRYLGERRFINDRVNYSLALELSQYCLQGKNPIEEYIRKINSNIFKNLKFLKRDCSVKIAGIEVGFHGDQGGDGKFGTVYNLENSLGKCVVGHSHSPKVMRGVYVVGTLSKLKLSYTQNESSWLHANCVIYKNGQRQMLKIINGNYKI